MPNPLNALLLHEPPRQPPNMLLPLSNALSICLLFLAISNILPLFTNYYDDKLLECCAVSIVCLWRNWSVYAAHRRIQRQYNQIQHAFSVHYPNYSPAEGAAWPPSIRTPDSAQTSPILPPNDETIDRIRLDRLIGICWSVALVLLAPVGLATHLSRDGLTPLNVISALSMALTAILSYWAANSVYDYRIRRFRLLSAMQQAPLREPGFNGEKVS